MLDLEARLQDELQQLVGSGDLDEERNAAVIAWLKDEVRGPGRRVDLPCAPTLPAPEAGYRPCRAVLTAEIRSARCRTD